MDCDRNRSTESSVRVAGPAVRRRLPRDDRPMIKVSTKPFRQSGIRELGARQSVPTYQSLKPLKRHHLHILPKTFSLPSDQSDKSDSVKVSREITSI